MRLKALRIMWHIVDDYIDGSTGEVCCTSLAEATALEMDQAEWLDDPEHDLWVWAYEVAEKHEKNLREKEGGS